MRVLTAAIYARISTDDQSDYSLDAQERACRAEVERRGWRLHDIYIDEGISAKNDKRPALQRLRADVINGRVQVVIVHKTDRLMRNLRLLLEFIEVIRDHKASFVSVMENIDLTTPMGWAMFQVHGVFSELHINNLREETKKGLLEKAQQGYWVGGICPYGYIRVDKDTIAPANDASTAAVRSIFEWYATGRYSYPKIADMANELECGRSFGVEAVRDILSNRAYLGYVSSGGQEFPGNHQPIIEPAVWQRCAELRAARTAKVFDADHPKARSDPQGILLDIGHCAACDQRLWQRKCGNKSSRNGYYMCAGRSRRNCDSKMSGIDLTDAAILDLVKSFSFTVDWQRSAIEEARIVTVQPAAPVVNRTAILAKIDKLSIAWTNGNLSDAAYEQQLATLKAQLAAQPEQGPRLFDLGAAAEVVTSLGALIDAATIEERRELVAMLFDRVWVEAGANIHAVQPKQLYGVLWRQTRRLVEVQFRAGNGPLSPWVEHFHKARAWSSFQVLAAS